MLILSFYLSSLLRPEFLHLIHFLVLISTSATANFHLKFIMVILSFYHCFDHFSLSFLHVLSYFVVLISTSATTFYFNNVYTNLVSSCVLIIVHLVILSITYFYTCYVLVILISAPSFVLSCTFFFPIFTLSSCPLLLQLLRPRPLNFCTFFCLVLYFFFLFTPCHPVHYFYACYVLLSP